MNWSGKDETFIIIYCFNYAATEIHRVTHGQQLVIAL